MTKKESKAERLMYCSGSNWLGDGSKATSPCMFGQSMITASKRFKCHYCASSQSPDGIYADANGVRKMVPKNALNNESPNPKDSPVESPESSPPEPPEVPPESAPVVSLSSEVSPAPEKPKTQKSKAKKRKRPRF